MSTPLARRLVTELAAGGVVRFDAFVERCLYDPDHGFYTASGGASGRRGDFITSPEVGPLFGAVLARALDRWWDEAGRPDPFVVVDAGAGPGTLLRSLLLAAPACARAWQLVAVERSDDLRHRHADLVERGVSSVPTLPELAGAVVLANELLDNLAFRLLERAGDGWAEVAVAVADGHLAPVLVDAPAADAALAGRLAPAAGPGARIPLLTAASAWVDEVLAAGPAHLVVFDYGVPHTAELVGRPWEDWVRTYRDHERAGEPWTSAGQADLTVEVAADQLPTGARWSTQAEALARWGIDELVAEGRRIWAEGAAAPTLAVLRARSRIGEAAALTDRDGLGSWMVGHWGPGSTESPGRGSR